MTTSPMMRAIAIFFLVGTTAAGRAVEIVTTNLPNGVEMVPYNATLEAANGTPPFAWSTVPAVAAWGSTNYGQAKVPSDLGNVVAIEGGIFHSLALRPDGTVVAWGANDNGQIDVPLDLSNVVAIAAGGYHSLALRSDGTVVAWGYNGFVQTNVPPGNVVAIAAGESHSLALLSDGTVTVWGNNYYGLTNAPSGLSNVAAIAAGDDYNLALRSNGTVVAWGYNSNGQTDVPVGLSNVVGIAAGWAHSLALRSDGTVVAWGYNSNGQTNVPSGLSNVVAVAAGGYHSLALRASNIQLSVGLVLSGTGLLTGTPLVAGTNMVTFVVQDMDNATTNRALELVIEPNPNTRPVISSNSPPAGAFAMAEASNQIFQVWATDPEGSNLTYSWTWDGVGVGGNDSTYARVTVWGDAGPHVLRCYVADDLWTNVVYAQWYVAVLSDSDADGMRDEWEVRYFGDKSRDGTGDYDGDGASDLAEYLAGSNPTVWPPEIVTISLPNGMEMIPYNITLLATNGTPPHAWSIVPEVMAWGSNNYGQTSVPSGLGDMVAIAGGAHHSLALRSDGTIAAWGRTNFGLTSVPSGLGNVVGIAAGVYHNLALRSDGTVAAWGHNYYGQANVPPGLGNVVEVAAGRMHSLALDSNGTLAAWGWNYHGQVNVPPGLSNVVGIAAGVYHNLALRSDGTVAAWGANGFGQTNVPSDLSNVVAVAAGEGHSLALRSDGAVVAWGRNDYDQASVPSNVSNVAAISAGYYHSLALRASNVQLPVGLTLSGTGSLTGTPLLAGTSLVTFVVQDVDHATTNRVLELVIEPNPNTRPVISSNSPPVGALAMAEATNQVFQVWATDPEGSNLTYSWTWDGAGVGGNDGAYTRATAWGDAGPHVLRCYVADDLWTNQVYAQWDVTVLADYDADGMPDEWEVAYFGSIGVRPGDDHDADRFTNLQEYWADTDPTRASSRPCVEEIRSLGGDVIISFVSVLGRKYRIESSDDLKDWSRIVQDNVVGTGGLIEVTDPGGGGATRRFYRVVVISYGPN